MATALIEEVIKKYLYGSNAIPAKDSESLMRQAFRMCGSMRK